MLNKVSIPSIWGSQSHGIRARAGSGLGFKSYFLPLTKSISKCLTRENELGLCVKGCVNT